MATLSDAVELVQEMEKVKAAKPEDASWWSSVVDVISAMRQKYPRYAKQLDPSDPDLVRTYMALSSMNVKRGKVGRVNAERLIKCRKTVKKKTDVVVSYVCLPKANKKFTKKNDAYWSTVSQTISERMKAYWTTKKRKLEEAAGLERVRAQLGRMRKLHAPNPKLWTYLRNQEDIAGSATCYDSKRYYCSDNASRQCETIQHATMVPVPKADADEIAQEIDTMKVAENDPLWRRAVDDITAMRKKNPRYAGSLYPLDPDVVRAYMTWHNLMKKHGGRVIAQHLVNYMNRGVVSAQTNKHEDRTAKYGGAHVIRLLVQAAQPRCDE